MEKTTILQSCYVCISLNSIWHGNSRNLIQLQCGYMSKCANGRDGTHRWATCLKGSMVSVLDSRPSGCEFNTRLRRTFFPALFSPLTSAEACGKCSL